MAQGVRQARRARRWGTGLVLVGLTAAGLVVSLSGEAEAFKPYTHAKTGQTAYNDVIADGMVTIDGKEFFVNPTLVNALRSWPAYYNAGVIGPDGFPDLVMGQSVIHPEDTGLWLRHLLTKAWQAQQDESYNPAEKGQILAFTYGFLTHAAGDMWAHTLINEMSEGVFPGMVDIARNLNDKEVALRHIILEGYIGAATQGFDNNPNESLLSNGDVAPDSTAGIPFAAPIRFIYNAMVEQSPEAPTSNRGIILNFFQGLRSDLAAWVKSDPDPLATIVGHFNSFVDKWNRERRPARCNERDDDGDGRVDEGCGFFETADFGSPARDEGASGNCNFGEGYGVAFAAVDAVRDVPACILVMGFSLVGETVGAITGAVADTALLLAKQVANAYVREWIADIDAGLQHWGELGLAVTRGLFDPQTRRDAQNDICRNSGPDIVTPQPAESETNPRRRCENGVGVVDTVLWSANDFINDYLLPMIGLPDWFSDIREALSKLGDLVSDGLAAALGPAYNPIRNAINGVTQPIKDWAASIIEAELSSRFGIPVNDIKQFLEEPTTRIDTTSVEIPARNYDVLGLFSVNIPRQTLRLLGPAARAKLDDYLGLPRHSVASPLASGERFNILGFKAYRNSVNLAKMLLLDGPGMDSLISTLIGGPYSLYTKDPDYDALANHVSNVMTTTMPGAAGPADQWLRMIDGDHAWRQDGKPVFTSPSHPAAGEGNFPLFESCLLRKRVFRKIFKDWENDAPSRGGNGDGILQAAENFPDLGDMPTADPAADDPPAPFLNISGPRVVIGDSIFVTGATRLSVAVLVPDTDLGAEWRVNDTVTQGGPFSSLALGKTFTLDDKAGLLDGTVDLEYTTEDACGSRPPVLQRIVLDRTPPDIRLTSPSDGAVLDTDTVFTVSYDATDVQGVGMDQEAGRLVLDGRVMPDGFQLNTNTMRAGVHTVQVIARDLLGNVRVETREFHIVATIDSLSAALLRGLNGGKFTDPAVHDSLQKIVAEVQDAHLRGLHSAEWRILRKMMGELETLRGESVDFTLAGRLASYAQSIITAESFGPRQFAPGASRRAGSRA